MRLRCVLVSIACLLAAAGCALPFPEALTSPQDRAFCIGIIRALQSGDRGAILKTMGNDAAARLEPRLPEMRLQLPTSPAVQPRLVGAKTTPLTAAHRSKFSYAMDEGARHVLIEIDFITLKTDVFLQNLAVFDLPAPVEDASSRPFTLIGLSIGQYFFLALCVLSAGTIVLALYALYRADNVARKWPWALACLFGLGQFTMGDGPVTFDVWAAQAFGVWAVKLGPLAPWRIGFGVPLFAYIFLLRQAHALASKREIPIQK